MGNLSVTLMLLGLLSSAEAPARPDSVAALAERWEDCHHWAGEDAYDAARERDIRRAKAQLRCGDLLRDERRLRRRFTRDPVAIAALDKMRLIEPDWPGPRLP